MSCPPPTQPACFCGRNATTGTTLLGCSRCKLVKYCSTGCQKYDWKSHKYICTVNSKENPIYPVKNPNKPSARGLFFSAAPDVEKPRFIEVAYTKEVLPFEGATFCRLEQVPEAAKHWYFQSIEVWMNVVTDHQFGHRLIIQVKEDGSVDGFSKKNQLLQKVCGENECLHAWAGPVRVMKVQERKSDWDNTEYRYLDMEVSDLRNIVDYCRVYPLQDEQAVKRILSLRTRFNFLDDPSTVQVGASGSLAAAKETPKSAVSASDISREQKGPAPKSVPASKSVPVSTSSSTPKPESKPLKEDAPKSATINIIPGPSVNGVVIHCEGEMSILRAPKFAEKRLSAEQMEDFFEAKWSISPVSALIGIPVKVTKVPWAGPPSKKDRFSLVNQSATFLFIEPSSGLAPLPWQDYVGSVLVARVDGKDLYAEHVEALCEFCQDYLISLFEEWTDDGMVVPVGNRRVDKAMTKEKFEEWFMGYRLEQANLTKGGKFGTFRWEK